MTESEIRELLAKIVVASLLVIAFGAMEGWPVRFAIAAAFV